MSPKKIKILFLSLSIAAIAGIGVWVYFALTAGGTIGKINLSTKYFLTEIRPNTFSGVLINEESYFLINEDRKTGEFYFKDINLKVPFIIINYKEQSNSTSFSIEYIYNKEIFSLTAAADSEEIRFKSVQDYTADITKQDPTNQKVISYDSTVLVFAKGDK
jgi:hypothetical protein